MIRLTIAVLAMMLPLTASAQIAEPGGHFIENWDRDGDARVTEAETAAKRAELFTMFDMDDDGALSRSEYDLFDETRRADMKANVRGNESGPMAKLDAGLTLDRVDGDGDGRVTRAEFAAGNADWFATIDRDGDGAITSDDFGPPRN